MSIEKEVTIQFDSPHALIYKPPRDDKKLYIQYTVGFEPKHWFKVVQDISQATRADTASERPKTHAQHALAIVPILLKQLDTSALSESEKGELRGHLALLYMQMMVFVERTLDLQKTLLESNKQKKEEEIASLTVRLESNILEAKKRQSLRGQLKTAEEEVQTIGAKIAAINRHLPFNRGQPKNKIAALPRAPLAEVYNILSPKVQTVLQNGAENIIDGFANYIEELFGLDFNEELELEQELEDEVGNLHTVRAKLIDYVRGGLGSGVSITQQVLFGGMNEVGIDRSHPGAVLLPMELRSLFQQRVTWNQLTADATKILRWSRNPADLNLA